MTKLFTRKHQGETYTFYLDGNYIKVETPPNGLGYPDTILLGERWKFDEQGYYVGKETYAYTLWRYLSPKVLAKICKQMLKAQKKYCLEV